MKIDKIDVFQLELPYSGGVYRLSGGRKYSDFDASLVKFATTLAEDKDLQAQAESCYISYR